MVIKGPEVLESTRALETIVLDKTGTVTEGRMSLDARDGVVTVGGARRERALLLAGALEAASEHPVAAAIAEAARAEPGELPPVRDFSNHEGRGVSGRVEGREAAVGRAAWLVERGVELPGGAREALAAFEADGATAVVLAVAADDGDRPDAARNGSALRAAAVLAVRDTIRPTSREAIGRLRELGVRPVLLTGDNARAAARVAAEVGIGAEDVRAEVLPGDKRDVVAALQAWWATASTTPRPWPRPGCRVWASPWARGRTWPLRPPISFSCAPIWAPSWTPSGSAGTRCALSSRTCSGPSPTMWRRFRWRRPDCSTP